MDDLINLFVDSNFTEETREDIYQAFGLFQTFNYLEPFPFIQDMLMTSDYHETVNLADALTTVVIQGQAFILDQHGIELNEETTMAFNNIVMKVLFQLQRLESPDPVLRILESMEHKNVRFSEIMEMYSDVPMTTFMQLIKEIRPVFLKNLASYLYSEESSNSEAVEEIPAIVEAIRLFKDVYGVNPAVRTILDAGTVMGEDFAMYLPLYDEIRSIVQDEGVLVECLLFLLLMSSNGVTNPMEVFSENSDYLISDLATANRLGKTLGEMYNKMQRHKERQIEKV